MWFWSLVCRAAWRPCKCSVFARNGKARGRKSVNKLSWPSPFPAPAANWLIHRRLAARAFWPCKTARSARPNGLFCAAERPVWQGRTGSGGAKEALCKVKLPPFLHRGPRQPVLQPRGRPGLVCACGRVVSFHGVGHEVIRRKSVYLHQESQWAQKKAFYVPLANVGTSRMQGT